MYSAITYVKIKYPRYQHMIDVKPVGFASIIGFIDSAVQYQYEYSTRILGRPHR